MEKGGNLHNHINSSNQLVCQLLNAYDKISKRSNHCYCWPHYLNPRTFGALLIERTTLKLDEVTTTLLENERMRNEHINEKDCAIAMEEPERGRSQSKRQGGPKGISRLQL